MQNFTAVEGERVILTGVEVEAACSVPPDNAYLIEDYPWGFRLRTEKAVWVERATKGAAKGQYRLVTATRDPKRAGRPWCKPKAGTYHDLMVAYLDGTPGDTFGHVHVDALSVTNMADAFVGFLNRWADMLTEVQLNRYKGMLAFSRRMSPNHWAEHDAKVAEFMAKVS